MSPRNYTDNFVAGILAQNCTLPILWAIQVEYGETGETFYLVNNQEDVSIDSQVYSACGFELRLPEEKEEGVRRGRIEVCNVDQLLTDLIRSVRGELRVTIMVVTPTNLSASPPEFDNIEYQFLPMVATDVTYDNYKARFNLSYELISHRRFPAHSYDPFDFPGLF